MEKIEKKKKNTKMNKNLKILIVESPAKIKTISKFLGSDFKIMSTFGHIKDLPERKLGVKVNSKEKTLEIEYVPMKDKKEVIDNICKTTNNAGEVYLASDPDREGEIISWHIGQEISKKFYDKSKIYRIVFNEITKPAILQAIENKSTVDMKKVRAQQARRILDRWVGYEVSPILWKKIAKGLSAGRVQSVAVMVICQREEEIQNFKPEEYWSIHAIFNINSKESFQADLFKINDKPIKLSSQEDTEKVLNELKNHNYIIKSITEKKRAKNPLPPFMTSTLQQDAYNKLGFSVDRTMSLAQKLYEGIPLTVKDKPEALITYMRTDSLRISDTAIKFTRNFINKEYGKEYLPDHTNVYSKAGAQDAHEAIRPINIEVTPEFAAKYLAPDQAKLYGLIWKRFVACQMNPAEYFQRQVLIEGDKFLFKATGSSLIFDGFLKVYLVEDEDEEQAVKIPKDIKEKDKLNLNKIDPKQHFTQPPARYTQATLVKELEKRGIGRPSTYATILSTIQKRKYVDFDKKKFFPTELGKTVNKMLVENFPDIINIQFTALMEEDLDKIADGVKNRDEVLFEFYDKFQKDLKAFGGNIEKHEPLKAGLKCPYCKTGELMIRFGKTGEFIGCANYPKCAYTTNFTRNAEGNIELAKSQTLINLNVKCPNCGKILVHKIGKFGPFLSCPGYPECKYIHQESLKMPCPDCKGRILKRKWRGGTFWGCENYPKCKFAMFSDVEETPCPNCKNPYLLRKKDKDGNLKYSCPNKECGFKKEEKVN